MGDATRARHWDMFVKEFHEEIKAAERAAAAKWGVARADLDWNADDDTARIYVVIRSADGTEEVGAMLPDLVFTIDPDNVLDEDRVTEVAKALTLDVAEVHARMLRVGLISEGAS